ncbi:hypothetical protein GDO86_008696 [Hymenochirus boettgeri]|uniref:CTCK domain-containing protein n=1 Tax=Hymenochirus boettgeri TaxID=247094 RepID=A0A8T2J3U4_9PIPI|nr:hypothetical protein GDO86_008696 [Hymenochirus boettgeri]
MSLFASVRHDQCFPYRLGNPGLVAAITVPVRDLHFLPSVSHFRVVNLLICPVTKMALYLKRRQIQISLAASSTNAPGESYTPDGDTCVTYTCKSDYKLDTNTEKCVITDQSQCPEGYEYKKPAGVCCGSCKKVECVIKMTDSSVKLLKPGDSYTPDGDRCVKYTCKSDIEVETHIQTCTITEPSQCPEGYEYKKLKDECCGQCVQVACPVTTDKNHTKLLKPGESYTPDGDTCVTYTCKSDYKLDTNTEKCVITDQSQCPEGYEYIKPAGVCCGSCKKVECVIKMKDSSVKLLKPGESYTPDGDTCVTYTCKSDYKLHTNTEKCVITNQSQCPEGYEYKKLKDECCGICDQVACPVKTDKNRTKLLRGTHVSQYTCKSDIEVETHITDIIGTLECGDNPDGYEYKKLKDECCGICDQVACPVKTDKNRTKLLPPGESYTPDGDTCVTYTCKSDYKLDTNTEKCVITDQSQCPEGYEYIRPAGVCCGSCKKVECVIKMKDSSVKLLKPGDSYTPDGDRCVKYTCKSDIEIETHIQTCTITEPSQCPEGYEYKISADECCGKCIQVECIIKMNDSSTHILKVIIICFPKSNVYITPGETYIPENDKCTSYKCTSTYQVNTTKETCPAFDSNKCIPGTIRMSENGCCKICEISSCRVHKESRPITHGKCVSDQTVELSYCDGNCNTKSMYSAESNAMEHKCSCCQETKTSKRTVELSCKDNTKSQYTYIYVEECGCTSTQCQVNTPTEPQQENQ